MVFKMLQVLRDTMCYYCNCTHFYKIYLYDKKIVFIFMDANNFHIWRAEELRTPTSHVPSLHFIGYGWDTFTLESS